MTKVIDGVRVFTFDEWSQLPETEKLFAKIDKCPECDGSGNHTCECGDPHECGYCDGTGNEKGIRPKEIYQKELRDELRRLLLWRDALSKPAKGE